MLVAEKEFSLIVFGASGALAKEKIFPALYEMALEGRLEKEYKVFGFARTKMSSEDFRKEFIESVEKKVDGPNMKILRDLADNCYYFAGDYNSSKDYSDFLAYIESIEKSKNDRVRLAYFSVPPVVFEPIVKGLGSIFKKSEVPLRLILEKPFGSDLKSAKALKDLINIYFDHSEYYLLDHYLGKEGVFNLLALRYANPIFSFLLQGQYISNIQISALEDVGLENRAGYFDAVGTLKDMIQSHLFQILAFLTMNVPRQFESELVHKMKTLALDTMYFDSDISHVVRGQYDGYALEKGVAPDSKTETFVALKLGLDSPEWHNIPIYLRTGKKLAKKWTGVVIEFKPHQNQEKLGIKTINRLLIQIQPQEKVEFYMYTKRSGEELDFVPLTTGKPIYCSGDCTNEHSRLLLEAIRGDKLLFLEFAEIFESWKITDKVADLFAKDSVALNKYMSKDYGPIEADEMLARDGFEWFNDF
jgi:glucose-6-phosphate 1-dehydrogenase